MRCFLLPLSPSLSGGQSLALEKNSQSTSNNSSVTEKRVIRQLLEALLFERLCEFSYQTGYFCFLLGTSYYRVAGRVTGFSRVRVNADKMFFIQEQKPREKAQLKTIEQEKIHQQKICQESIWRPITLARIISDLPASQAVKQLLSTELEQTVMLCDWNNQHLTRFDDRRQLTYTQLESAIDEGHPYHPCFKARTGFSEQDHMLFGPEYANQFQLHWLAIRRCYLKRRFNSVTEKVFWQTELGDECYQNLCLRVAEETDDSAAFSLMPIHPWQWKNLQQKLATAIAEQQIVYLGEAGDKYQASISVRTLLNVSDPKKANIKLPLNIVNTSSLRTIESHSICTAPVISDWLSQLVASDGFLQERMILLTEYAGIRPANDGTKPQPWIEALDGQLGVIFRQSLMLHCNDETVIPFVALAVIEKDGQPFIEPWVKKFGCEAWLTQLLETAVIPIWHLLVHHGIALEAHGQNILVQHNQGWPEKVIVRDFHESLEYVHDYLEQPELAPIFSEFEEVYCSGKPNQYYWMSDVEALRELVVDTLFVFNLTDLAVLLEDHYQYAEAKFWQLVFNSFKKYQAAELTSQARISAMDIFQQNIRTESLLDKKLRGDRETEFHHQIDNPLAKAARQDALQQSNRQKNQRNSEASSATSAVLGRTPCLP